MIVQCSPIDCHTQSHTHTFTHPCYAHVLQGSFEFGGNSVQKDHVYALTSSVKLFDFSQQSFVSGQDSKYMSSVKGFDLQLPEAHSLASPT